MSSPKLMTSKEILDKIPNPLARILLKNVIEQPHITSDTKKINGVLQGINSINQILESSKRDKDGGALFIAQLKKLAQTSQNNALPTLSPEQIKATTEKVKEDPFKFLDFESKNKYKDLAKQIIKKDSSIKDKATAYSAAATDPTSFLNSTQKETIFKIALDTALLNQAGTLRNETEIAAGFNPLSMLNDEEKKQAHALECVEKAINSKGDFFHKEIDAQRILNYVHLLESHSSSNPRPLITKMETVINNEISFQSNHLAIMKDALQAITDSTIFKNFEGKDTLQKSIEVTEKQVSVLQKCQHGLEKQKERLLGTTHTESSVVNIELKTPVESARSMRRP